jgi:hypothetical protein
VPPGQPQQGGAGRLHRLAGHDAVDHVRGELPRRQHAALGVAPRRQAEELVVHGTVDHGHGEQVGGVGQRVGPEAQAPDADLTAVERGRHVPGERPGVVVHRAGPVILRTPAEFLVELTQHAPPQREVLPLVPRGVAGGLEHADRDHLVHPARVADLGRVPPVQQERGPPGGRVEPERQRADGQVGRAAAQVARVGDAGAQAGRFVQVARAEPAGGELVRGRLAGVDAVEVAAAGERQPGQVGLCQPVGRAVLEHRRGGQVAQRGGVARVPGPVRPLGQQRGRDLGPGRGGLRGELQLEVLQRDRPGGPPPGGGQQRGPGHPAAGRVAGGRGHGQVVTVLLQVGPDPQPVALARGQRPGRWHPGSAGGVAIIGQGAGTGRRRGCRAGRSRRGAS